jgi:flagellar motility protein MotE (MotC chaperone)
MTYQDYIIKCEVAKTVFQCGVSAALQVENATPEQRLAWIAEDLKQLETELEQLHKTFDEQDEVGDPFVVEVK